MPTYTAEEPGASLLPNPELLWITVNDPLLGTANAGVPEGPFNRELHKLLQNDSALANLFLGYIGRSVGAVENFMPDPMVVPSPMPGASVTPGHGAYHTVFYFNREVLFKYNASSITPGWEYVVDVARVTHILTRSAEQVSVVLNTENNYASVTIPEGYSISHLKSFYVVSTGDPETTPLVSVLPGVFNNSNVIQFTLSTTPALPETYTLVCLFEAFANLA